MSNETPLIMLQEHGGDCIYCGKRTTEVIGYSHGMNVYVCPLCVDTLVKEITEAMKEMNNA